MSESESSRIDKRFDKFESGSSDMSSQLSTYQKRRFQDNMLQVLLPCIGTDPGKVLLTEVIVSLKYEGLLDNQLKEEDVSMVNILQDSLLNDPAKYKLGMSVSKQGDYYNEQ